MKICVGIDAGSRAIKIVLLNADTQEIVAKAKMDQGIEQSALASQLFGHVLNENNLSKESVVQITATGYGRNIVEFADETVTEITCHARGVRHLHPGTRTVVEIGGQDSKWLCLDEAGSVRDFCMNDRCAAGTGRFMEVVATRLGVKLEDLGGLSERSTNPAIISSMCVVFAETEIIGLLASGTSPEDIVAGVQSSIVSRVAAMAGRRVADPVVFTGGVALIPGMRRALESTLNHTVSVADDPQMTGALGAALLASKKQHTKNKQ